MKQEYDAVFTTEVATIGIRLEGSRLIKLDYLTRRKSKKPTSKYAEKIRDKIERYLDANSRVKTLKVDVTLDVTPFQQKVLRQLELIPYGKTKTPWNRRRLGCRWRRRSLGLKKAPQIRGAKRWWL